MQRYVISHQRKPETGFVIVLFCLLLPTIIAFLAFASDKLKLYAEQRRLQIDADALSIAGAGGLGPSADYASVAALISNVAQANNVPSLEMTNPSPRCGTW